MRMQNRNIGNDCEKCKRFTPHLDIFLFNGKMICRQCYMNETYDGKIVVDEKEYHRNVDSLHNRM